jgi:rod shape-determining protein MreC
LLLCFLLSVAFLIADARYRYLEDLRQGVAVVIYPLQRLAAAPLAIMDRIGEFFVTQSALRSENAQRVEQSLQDAALLQRHKALAAENAHLRELLAARQRLPGATTAAEVLYAGRDPFSRKIVIDKGRQQGIMAGQPVIDHIGVIGQVTRVYPWLAEVTLITDKEQAVPVQNLRNGLRAVLGGTGNDGQLELKFIPHNADFQNGDEMVTSGIDGVYPPGLPVAKISNIERNAAYPFARIVCKPLAGIASHRHLLVLKWENTAPPPPPAEPPPTRPKKSRKGE